MTLGGDKLGVATNYFMTAEWLVKEGDFKRAESFYSLANSLDPNPLVAAKLVSVQNRLGKQRVAQANIDRMILLYPRSRDLHLLMAKMILSTSRKKSIYHTRRALQLSPDYEPAYEQLFFLHHSVGERQQAKRIVNQIIKNFPGSATGFALRTLLHLERKKYRRALISSEKAYRLNSSNAKLLLTYARVLEINGQKRKADGIYQKFFAKPPDLEDLVQRTLFLYQTFGDFSAVLKTLDRLQNAVPSLAWSLSLQRVFVLWELKQEKKALSVLQQLDRIHPLSEIVAMMSGMSHGRLGQTDEAIRAYLKVPKNTAYYVRSRLYSVTFLQKLKDYDRALRILESVLEERFIGVEVFLLGAELHSSLGDNTAAIGKTEDAIERFPMSLIPLFFRGVYEERAGLKEDCIATMKLVLSKDPNHSKAMNYLGYMYAEMGENLDEAESLLLKALKLEPENGSYLDSLGWVYYKKGQYHEALDLLFQAVKYSPKEGIIYEKKKMKLAKTGR